MGLFMTPEMIQQALQQYDQEERDMQRKLENLAVYGVELRLLSPAAK